MSKAPSGKKNDKKSKKEETPPQESALKIDPDKNIISNPSISHSLNAKKTIKNKNQGTSFVTMQSTLLNSLNTNNSINLEIQLTKMEKKLYEKEKVPFEDYLDIINTSMDDYRIMKPRDKTAEKFSPTHAKNKSNLSNRRSTEDNKTDTILNENLLTTEDQSAIKKVYELNRSLITKGLSSVNEDSALKINIPEYEYRNPYQSMGILRHNQVIYDEISKKFLIRQKDLFDESIKTYEGYTMKYKVKMPKIKIISSSPKINLEIPVIDMVDESKKKEVSSLPPIPQNHLRLFAYYRYPNKNFPEGREQFSLCTYGNEIIMLGGIGSIMKTMNIWALRIDTLEWRKIIPENMANVRFGHTGIMYQNKIYVFGGRTKISNGSIIADFDIFSLNDRLWLNPSMAGKNTPQLRRNHIAQLVGNQMIIHGGLGDNGKILSDCYLLNFNPIKWQQCLVNPYCFQPAAYGHSSALVVQSEILSNHRFNIYKYPDTGIKNNLSCKMKERGLYIFGGKTKEEGGITNELYVLLFGKKPLEWIRPDTKGTPPRPRYFHSMSFFEKGNFLIIHGGRNDLLSDSFALDDTFIFDLENFDWLKVELYSHVNDFKILSRCCHQSIIYCKI